MLFAHHFHSSHFSISTSYRFLSVWFIYNVLSFSLDGCYPGVPAQKRRHPYHVSDTCISLQEVGDRQGRLGAQDVWWLFSLSLAACPIDTSHREAPTPIKDAQDSPLTLPPCQLSFPTLFHAPALRRSTFSPTAFAGRWFLPTSHFVYESWTCGAWHWQCWNMHYIM